MRAAALFAVALAAACAAPAPARAPSVLDVFAPLMGCWRGEFEGQAGIHDERCFEPLGAHVVDRHAVRPTSYAGEATYHLNDATDEIVFAYASNDGGRSNGVMCIEGDTLVFPAHFHFSGDGARLELRSTWRMEGSDRLTMVSERREDGDWRPYMRITYTRAQDAR